MGNHDEWFVEYLKTGIHPVNWKMGGDGTAISYLREINKDHLFDRNGNGYITGLNPGDIPDSHRDFFNRMRYYYREQTEKHHFLFVHGGLDPDYNIEYQHQSMLMWDRNLWDLAKIGRASQNVDRFTKIFIGHTHVNDWRNPSALPLYEDCVWNLDTGSGWSGKLTIMDINTEEYWQSDFVTKLYPHEEGRRKNNFR